MSNKSIEDYLQYTVEEGPLKVNLIQVMHGANYFSGGPVVRIKLDLGKFDEVFTNLIEGFPAKIKMALPSLKQHHCSEGYEGGFFKRIDEGTLLGHVIEHVAIELQTLAGMDVGYGKTRSTLEPGVYNIIFRFMDEVAGIYAGKAAVNLINSLLLDKPFDWKLVVEDLSDIREQRLLGPSTQAIVRECERRDIPWMRKDMYNLVQLGTGKYHKLIRATITSDTNLIAVETADNKHLTSILLKEAGIPVPLTIRTDNIAEARSFFTRINAPIVIKPSESNLGKGMTININSEEELTSAFAIAQEIDTVVLAQQYISGKSYRFLVVDYNFVAASELTPPYITGNGRATILELINDLNRHPHRQYGDKGNLSRVEVDDITMRLLARKGYTLETVLPDREEFFLKISGNMKLGGSATDVTKNVHHDNKVLAERVARTIGLNVAGIDIIARDIEKPIEGNEGYILEVNAAPDFRIHTNPSQGEKQNVAEKLVEMMFPFDKATRVPIFSVTGTSGKTTVVHFLDHCLRSEGIVTGLMTSDGVEIAGKKIISSNEADSSFVAKILSDSSVECAVLESSMECILRDGLGYKFSDIGIVLNVNEEHIGKEDMRYVEDIAYAKSVVAEEVYSNGHTILNADQELVLEMRERLYSKPILFSLKTDNIEFNKHVTNGGTGFNIESGAIYLHVDRNKKKVCDLVNVPLSFDAKAEFLYEDILAVSSALYAYGMDIEKIAQKLSSFIPDHKSLPGRMNLIDLGNRKILLDNAHNKFNYTGLKNYLASVSGHKIGVVEVEGDRSDEEIIILGHLAALTYDSVYFYERSDRKGRKEGEVTELLKAGAIGGGYDANNIMTFGDLSFAIHKALESKDAFVVIISTEPGIAFDTIYPLLNT